METNKCPAFLFYSADFLADTRLMTYEEIGMFITLLCIQHQHGHLSENDMLRICGTYTLHIYDLFEIDSDGKYFNNRLEIEGIKRSKYVESRRENRSKKTYVKHMENGNINENINEFISNNNYSIELRDKIIDWLEYKVSKNEQYQEKGFKSLLTQIKNGISVSSVEKMVEVIDMSMANNYKGILFDKLKEIKPTKSYMSNYDKSQQALEEFRKEHANDANGNE